jgi:hypothetical protein
MVGWRASEFRSGWRVENGKPAPFVTGHTPVHLPAGDLHGQSARRLLLLVLGPFPRFPDFLDAATGLRDRGGKDFPQPYLDIEYGVFGD